MYRQPIDTTNTYRVEIYKRTNKRGLVTWFRDTYNGAVLVSRTTSAKKETISW